MRTNIPQFRLPPQVLDEEIGYILDMDVRRCITITAIDSMQALLDDGGFDAVFVGTGAPRGKELQLPGRDESRANLHRHRLARIGCLRATPMRSASGS